MITVKSQFVQYLLTMATLFFVVGALSMIWPIILGLLLGVLLLFQSCCAESETAMLWWTSGGHVSLAFASLWDSSLAVIFRDEFERRVRQLKHAAGGEEWREAIGQVLWKTALSVEGGRRERQHPPIGLRCNNKGSG